jgi:predicted nucleotidyltransferase
MDLSDPTRAVTPTLDGPVLAVLAAAGRPLTVGEVAAQSARGSEIGIRRTLIRLVDQGLVRATLMGRNRVHELNRDHLAAGAADVLADLRVELWRRFRAEFAAWKPAPIYACVFGSAARADGDENSDIDLLLVHSPLTGERRPRRSQTSWTQVFQDLAASSVVKPGVVADAEDWAGQVDRVRGLVRRWTGNSLQVIDLSFYEWWEPSESHAGLLANVNRDAIELTRSPALHRAPIVGASGG